MSGLIYAKHNADGSIKSSVDKFFGPEELQHWATLCGSNPGDLILVLAGSESRTRKAMSELRLEMGERLGLRDKNTFRCAWVLDFPLLEKDEDSERWHAMHHPFTSALPEDLHLLDTDPGKVRANAYDMVINGVEVGGGSIRIHNKEVQKKMFSLLGFSDTPRRAVADPARSIRPTMASQAPTGLRPPFSLPAPDPHEVVRSSDGSQQMTVSSSNAPTSVM